MFGRSYRLPFTLLGIPILLDLSFLAHPAAAGVDDQHERGRDSGPVSHAAPGKHQPRSDAVRPRHNRRNRIVRVRPAARAVATRWRRGGTTSRSSTSRFWFLGGVAAFDEIPRQAPRRSRRRDRRADRELGPGRRLLGSGDACLAGITRPFLRLPLISRRRTLLSQSSTSFPPSRSTANIVLRYLAGTAHDASRHHRHHRGPHQQGVGRPPRHRWLALHAVLPARYRVLHLHGRRIRNAGRAVRHSQASWTTGATNDEPRRIKPSARISRSTNSYKPCSESGTSGFR